MKHNWIRGLKMVLFMAAALVLSSLAVMILWNWLVPTLFGLPAISVWQALGLLILSKILFGRHWGPGRMYRRHRKKPHEHDDLGQSP